MASEEHYPKTRRKRKLSIIYIVFAVVLITALLAGPGVLQSHRKGPQGTAGAAALKQQYSSVCFRQSRVMVYTGCSRKLTPLKKESKKTMPKLHWKVKDRAVASIDQKGHLRGKKAGRTTVTCTTARHQKLHLNIIVRQKPKKKVIYLTFDDGPGPKNTPKLLRLLKQYDAKATFFLIGRNASAHPEIVKQEYDQGHTVAIHTYTHKYQQIYASTTAFFQDFDKTERLLRKITGDTPRFNRMPGGSNNTIISRQDSKQIQKILRKRGYVCMDWNAVTNDAVGVNYSVDTMVHYGVTSINAVKTPVVLIHDEDTKTNTVPVVRRLLRYYTAKGYSFEPLDLYDGKPIQFIH